jgi:hypothetical protein
MKKQITLLLLCSFTAFLFGQKPQLSQQFNIDKLPQYCGSTGSSSADSSRLPILFRASLSGLNPGSTYKYFVRFISLSDTGNVNSTGAGNPIFFKNGNWTSTNAPHLDSAGRHDTVSLTTGPMLESWFGAFYNNDSRFTPGKYIYPIFVLQEIGSTDIIKLCIPDSIKVLGFSPNSGTNNGSAIWGSSSIAQKNFVLLYDNTSGVSSRPLTITYTENEGLNNSNTQNHYTNLVNGKTGNWGTIIPNTLSNGVRRIESKAFNNTIIFANIESDGIWGLDSTINPRKGYRPISIKNDNAPLRSPEIEFISSAVNLNEGVGIAKLLVRRRFGNHDSTKVFANYFVGSATPNVDFTNLNGNPLFVRPYGTVIDTLRIQIKNDSLSEGTENANFRLTNSTNAIINNLANSIQMNIIDNDIPTYRFAKNGAVVNEDNGLLSVKLKVDFGSINPSTVRVVVKRRADSTFIPSEFRLGNSNRDTTIQFNGGKVSDSISFKINIINDLTPERFNDTIVFALRNPSNPGSIGRDSLFTLVIRDDDTPPTFNFEFSKITVQENVGTVNVKIKKTGRNKNPSDFIISHYSLTSTATDGSDFNYSTQIITSDVNDLDTSVNITIVNDNNREFTETALFVIRPSFNVRIGKPDTLQVIINDDDIANYNISRVTSTKAPNNLVDSIGTKCGLRGVVYGTNLSTLGLEFTLIDPTGGIQVVNSNTKNYSVTEGDSIFVIGRIAQVNGMARITALDTIIRLASSRTLRNASVVSSLNESTESRFVRFNLVKLANPSLWPTAALANNTQVTLKVLTQSDSFDLVIDSETDIDGKTAPAGFFNLSGIGFQNDATSPFNSGYSIKPRRFTDFQQLNAPIFSFTPSASLAIENRDSSEGFTLQCANIVNNQQISLEIKGGTATRNTDYQSNQNRLFILTPSKPSVNIKIKLIDDAIVEAPETIIFVIRGNQWGTLVGADSIQTITIVDDESTNIALNELSAKTKLYPNPTLNQFNIETTETINSIEVLDITGKQIFVDSKVDSKEYQSKSLELNNGVYIIKIKTDLGSFTKQLMIKH